MGSLISRFRKQPTSKDKLEKLDKSIKSLEQYHFSTQQRQKHLVGALLLYSILIYICLFAVFYFLYFPKDGKYQALYSLPFLLFPILVYAIKKFMHLYFRRKISSNDIKLVKLRKEKKLILEKVMETETYKVAKDILDKFDTEKQNKPSATDKLKQTAEEMELRKRTDSARGIPPNQSYTNPANGAGVLSTVRTPRGYVQPAIKSPALVRPVLPKDRGVADRIVEYLIGDGPNHRYALICRRCNSHNGMALQEEFEFIAFRCCYCQYPNPARKLRPNAPKLPDSPQPSPCLPRKTSPDPTSTDDCKSEGETEEEVMSEPDDQKEQSSAGQSDTQKSTEKSEKEGTESQEESSVIPNETKS